MLARPPDRPRGRPPAVDLGCAPAGLVDRRRPRGRRPARRSTSCTGAILDARAQLSDARETGQSRAHRRPAAGPGAGARVRLPPDHPAQSLELLVQRAGGDHVRIGHRQGPDTGKTAGRQRCWPASATARVIGLCSDSISEAVNLQGAAVRGPPGPAHHPAGGRAAGRADRPDEQPPRHDRVLVAAGLPGVRHPRRANGSHARARDSAALLGANLDLPPVGPA